MCRPERSVAAQSCHDKPRLIATLTKNQCYNASMQLPLNNENTPSFVTELLYRLKIRDVMTRDLFLAKRTDSLRSIQQLMKLNRITGVPVEENGRLVGLVSMDDIIRALDQGYIDESADGRMTRNCIVLEDDMPLSFGIGYMEKYHFGRFPVLNKDGLLVGIITSRDIIVHLLLAVNREVEIMEEKLRLPSEPNTDPQTIYREFVTRRFDFENAGKPSSDIKKICKEANLDPKLIRRIAVASYELEMNQVIHSTGGVLIFKLEPGKAHITARDTGPGIPDLEQALAEGYSTATEWVRSLGFGAGMGLPNTKRVADEFTISSSSAGTSVVCGFTTIAAAE